MSCVIVPVMCTNDAESVCSCWLKKMVSVIPMTISPIAVQRMSCSMLLKQHDVFLCVELKIP